MIEELFALHPYSLGKEDKEEMLSSVLSKLTLFHYSNSLKYKKILDISSFDVTKQYLSHEIPFIPANLFKEFELLSCPKEQIIKTLTSSGTSGQAVSKVFLNADNVKSQTKVLNIIIASFIGKQRLPLLLFDTEAVKKDRSMYSARGAGIIGFSLFGRDICYALNENMNIDIPKIEAFLQKHEGKTILMFGYTYMIWQFVVRELEKVGKTFKIQNGILFHIGGWKKLKDQAVDTDTYNQKIKTCFGNINVYNYYGMVEQLGSVYVECEHGNMHTSIYSDIIIRKAQDFSPCNIGEKGIIQVLSVLPTSYPGHSLLTEDEGQISGIDDCACGRKGKYFKIIGRIKSADLRGCSDTYERN